jgi:prevent-host-death family protein
MSVTNIHQAKTNLSKLIEAAERGEEVIIARNGKPAVRIVPIAPPLAEDPSLDTPGKRIAGMWAGKIVIHDPDWWKEDEELTELFYADNLFPEDPKKDPNAA